MHNKTRNALTAVLFSSFLLLMLALLLILPRKDFSQNEKRYLAEFPKPDWQSVSSGKWGSDLETYLADHLPFRDFFVGLNAYADLAIGKQVSKDIRVAGDRLVEAPVVWNEALIQKNLKAIGGFTETIGKPVSLSLVPSAGWAAGLDSYEDDTLLERIYSMAGEGITSLSIAESFRNRPELYYRTDHHWTSQGAYTGYCAMMEALSRPYPAEDAFQKELLPDLFQGSTYSRSALWLTKPEALELWHGSSVTVSNAETEGEHEGVFYRERLEENDKYTVFLDGNHSLVRLHNPEKTGSLLVIRDSYSNCLGCFLAESYGEVVMVDLRYYRSPVSDLVAQEGFDDILVCYSIGNFLTDTNMPWLR